MVPHAVCNISGMMVLVPATPSPCTGTARDWWEVSIMGVLSAFMENPILERKWNTLLCWRKDGVVKHEDLNMSVVKENSIDETQMHVTDSVQLICTKDDLKVTVDNSVGGRRIGDFMEKRRDVWRTVVLSQDLVLFC